MASSPHTLPGVERSSRWSCISGFTKAPSGTVWHRTADKRNITSTVSHRAARAHGVWTLIPRRPHARRARSAYRPHRRALRGWLHEENRAAQPRRALNTLLASPSLASWRQGADLDVAGWLTPRAGKTPIVIVSVSRLDDEERSLVLGVLLGQILSWVRTLPGTQRLRALVVFDEVYGFLPHTPANPATKRPLVALMKQARAFGIGILVATQRARFEI